MSNIDAGIRFARIAKDALREAKGYEAQIKRFTSHKDGDWSPEADRLREMVRRSMVIVSDYEAKAAKAGFVGSIHFC